ncbi:hypothetical protein FHS76_003975 [Ochrobactrum daejeonense]|uniref:Uncharacterized protein n=1 Tax=Brucella daejeonensis TaxID=659015 RepID=A0A7W9B0L8_9HYPH|nr:hypothetical protein [Brucella daejeonensis]MBB5704060.1 hypothetical protein [Brucella daejeonensis]NKB79540.1 hypothetical protein [Brucella daejeonensis]
MRRAEAKFLILATIIVAALGYLTIMKWPSRKADEAPEMDFAQQQREIALFARCYGKGMIPAADAPNADADGCIVSRANMQTGVTGLGEVVFPKAYKAPPAIVLTLRTVPASTEERACLEQVYAHLQTTPRVSTTKLVLDISDMAVPLDEHCIDAVMNVQIGWLAYEKL